MAALTVPPPTLDLGLGLGSSLIRVLEDLDAQLALTWLLSQQPWIVPIPGTKRIPRLQENAGAAAVELTEAQLAELREAADQIRIVGARYPEAQDRMTNQDAPPPSA